MFDYQEHRYGYAGLGTPDDAADARLRDYRGLFSGCDALRPLHNNLGTSVFINGGAGSGKGSVLAPMLIDGAYTGHIISQDFKGQNGAVSALQVWQGRHVYNFSPRQPGGVRINPLSPLKGDSPTLVPDTLDWAKNTWIPHKGSSNGEFFENMAQRFLVSSAVTYTELTGQADLPGLADLMNKFGSESDEWLGFEYHMTQSRHPFVRDMALELQQSRESNGKDTGGFQGSLGEVRNSFDCMADPQLREAVSPPYDFDVAELARPGGPPILLNIQEELHLSPVSNPVIRSIFQTATIEKRRVRGGRRIVYLMDEIGNVSDPWPLPGQLATNGRSDGIICVFVTQATKQLDHLQPNGASVIPNSCGAQLYLGTRSHDEAEVISKSLGEMTLEVEDFQTNESARHELMELSRAEFSGYANPFENYERRRHLQRMATHQTKMARRVLTATEIMNLPAGTGILFMPGVLRFPMLVQIPNYWQRADLAGLFMPDPYHVRRPGFIDVCTGYDRFGRPRMQARRIIRERCPPSVAHWPQYREAGEWAYVEGFRPPV